MNFARRIKKLELALSIDSRQEPFRIFVEYVGGQDDAGELPATCTRTRCATGLVSEVINFGSHEPLEGDALEQWIAGFPIERQPGMSYEGAATRHR